MIAVVTGATRGIGRATAFALAARGLDVALLGRTESELAAVAALVRGGRALSVPCDVSSSRGIDEATAQIARELGVPDVLVNNAGVVERALVEETSEDAWDRVVDVNLKAPFLLARAFLPAMKARRSGRIVNVSSISATLGTPRLASYCASKWGLVGFTKALAEELRDTGVQTMAILPGSVDTDMLRGSGFAPQMSPDDVARTIVWLALDAPAAMNGSAVEAFGP